MKVRATKEYKANGIFDSELKAIPEENQEFEISEERFHVLNGNNPYKKVFVIKVEEEKEEVQDEQEEQPIEKIEKKAFIKPIKNAKTRNL